MSNKTYALYLNGSQASQLLEYIEEGFGGNENLRDTAGAYYDELAGIYRQLYRLFHGEDPQTEMTAAIVEAAKAGEYAVTVADLTPVIAR